jgi:hypothetical protein
MKLNVPLLVRTTRSLSDGAVDLGMGMALKADHHGRGEKLLKTAAYVRVWQPGEMGHTDNHARRNFAEIRFSAPQLVRYFPREPHGHGPEVNVGWTDESGNKRRGWQVHPYGISSVDEFGKRGRLSVPALLCKDEAEAEAVFAYCAGYKKCRYCGDPFVPIRKDQKCCTKKNHSVLYRINLKRKRDARKSRR